MKSVLKPVSSPFPADSIERILSRYFARLAEWGQILTRGDHTAAEEIVQDLCLHLTVARPDLSGVNDLDAYLYTCLRNMYVSRLARVSRERLRVIQVEDYDAVGMVVACSGADSVDVQNELIRISDYVMSRKYSSKSASHFILHFFLGYRRSDVAVLARLPIAAIYNKLKEIRTELRQHLSSGEKIRLVARGSTPERKLLRTAVSSDLFLRELRSTILDADPSSCVPEGELIASYRAPDASPVGCRELAHLAGCERCLESLGRALRLEHRDGPLDGPDNEQTPKRQDGRSFDATMRMVRRRREQLLERRPGLLAIAVDGRVVAFHAIESARNSLSTRVDAASAVRFIEVFDEFGDRLAHIPLDAEPAAPSIHSVSQQVLLSDDRRLRLEVHFDGLGIHAEVDYADPALASSWEAAESSSSPHVRASWWSHLQWPGEFRFAPWSAVAFTSLLLAGVLGIAGYRYTHPGWRDVLARAQAVTQSASSTETLHQTLRIEEAMGSANGTVLGTIDIWRSGDRNAVRRLYNARQQLLATSIATDGGTTSDRIEAGAFMGEKERQIVESGVWRSDVSSAAFDAGLGAAAEAFRGASGFEVTQREDGRSGILSRTLVLDRDYQVQAERVRFRTAAGTSEVRLVQTLLRRVPNKEVPDKTFPQWHGRTTQGTQSEGGLQGESGSNQAGDISGVNLEVVLLFELFKRNADTGQPVEVIPIAGGRVRMTGTLADAQLLATIRASVAALPNASRVDFEIRSVKEAASAVHRANAPRVELVGASSDAPAAGLLRDALMARGLKGTALKTAEQEFAASALAHAQAALQHAYALDRLGGILTRAGGSSLDPDMRLKWAQMADRHSGAAKMELEALRLQLDSVSAGVAGIPFADAHGIADATAFIRATSELRTRTQAVNAQVVELFAGSAANMAPAQAQDSLSHLRSALPVVEASRMNSFASHLESSSQASQSDVGEMHNR
jgi:DNA-directed RNA polymerase specialized sigma24 family protein